MKQKVLALIEELNPASELLTDDPDIATKIAVYDANFNLIVVLRYSQMGKQHADGYYYNGKLINEESTLFAVECQNRTNLARGVYMRICTVGDGAELVVTVNEEITYG